MEQKWKKVTFFHKYINNTNKKIIMKNYSNITANFTPSTPVTPRRGTGAGTGVGTSVPTGCGMYGMS